MLPWLGELFGNPSGAHRVARAARAAIDEVRDTIAEFVGVAPGEVVFTSGGTESDNLAVIGGTRDRSGAIVISAVEHPAVVKAALATGHEVRVAPVDGSGLVDTAKLGTLLSGDVALVSVQLANHETGAVQPFEEIAAVVRRRAPRALLHTDAVQAAPWLDLARECPSADLVTVSGHKLGGPQGTGALATRNGPPLRALLHGGGQERELRSGTQNVAGIVGFGAAVSARAARRGLDHRSTAFRRDALSARIVDDVADCAVTAADTVRLPGHLHLRFAGIESESLLILLDEVGVFASAGAACASGALDPSPVLLAMGISRGDALSSLRLSLGPSTTDAETDRTAVSVAAAVGRLRSFDDGDTAVRDGSDDRALVRFHTGGLPV
jgi:cysteine desulfurase